MCRQLLPLLLFLVLPVAAVGQQAPDIAPEWFGLEHLSEYIGLHPGDISFRRDYTEPDTFRLEVVAALMEQPLGMMEYAENLKDAAVRKQPEILAAILYSDLLTEYQTDRIGAYQPDVGDESNRYSLFFTNVTLNQIMTRAAAYLDEIFPRSTEMMLARLDSNQKRFLTNQFKQLLETSVDEEFMSAEVLDSLENVEEEYVEEFVTFGALIDKDPIVAAGIDCLQELLLEVKALRRKIDAGDISVNTVLANTEYLPPNADYDAYLGRQSGWRVGGPGNDYYDGDYSFIIDLGGDDIYDLSYNPARPHGVIIIDLSGNDHYRGKTDFAIASGCLSVGLLLDFEGNDRYDAKSFSLGSGYFGFGLLYDETGDDRYDGDTHVQGAGSFGLGMIVDEDGRDTYNAALYSQGFGFTEGIGVIYETDGADTYYAGGKYKDHLRYDDHYLSLSQGFGYGLRPWMSGGIGAIIDLAGNDLFYGDIFAQACSYWWSLGIIYDSSGNDNYQCFQYGQGAATHMTLGILINDDGDDVYFGKGLMHGCGHDYSCGIILDRAGNDTYTAYDLSQAAGSANGVGIQIDNAGDDRYFSKNAANTQGYGNPRRDFGSIGLFIDLGGDDQYAGNGRNNYYWKTNSRWGGGMDIELNPPDTTEAED
jgi:hypothetical protein